MKPQITPPLELIQEWACMLEHRSDADVFTKAVQWGADQELDACCNYFEDHLREGLAIELRAARRPKSPTLKEQALALVSHDFSDQPCLSEEGYAIIRRALEALPND